MLGEINHALEAFGDLLSGYTDHVANEAKAWLQDMAAHCGPSTAALQRSVRLNSERLGNFYLARLVREAGVQARNMAKSCKELHDKHDEDPVGSLATFIRDALESAKSLAQAFRDYNESIDAMDDLVAQIGVRCGKHPELPVSPLILPLVVPKPDFRIFIHPDVPGGGAGITLPGLKLPGQRKVIPKVLPSDRGLILIA